MEIMSEFRTTEVSRPELEVAGLRFITVKTPNLAGRGDIVVFVPDGVAEREDLPIHILLHGVYGSAWCWAFKGGAHRTAARMMEEGEIGPAIIAMPSDGLWGDGSGYRPHHGRDFARWIVEDVPAAVRENIPAAGSGSPLCLGGLSMGGYGALLLGGRFPEHFRAVSGHSSITRLEQMTAFVEEPLEDYAPDATPENVIEVLLAKRDRLPALRFDCGLNDELLGANRLLHQELQAAGIPHVYAEFDGGHEWSYWEKHLATTFHFFADSTGG